MGRAERAAEMSALDDLMARDAGTPQSADQGSVAQGSDTSALDALMARDSGQSTAPSDTPRIEVRGTRDSVDPSSNSLLNIADNALAKVSPFGHLLLNAVRGPGTERDALKGVPSGFADVGNTLLNGAAKVLPDGFGQWNADRQASLDSYNKDNNSVGFGVGRLLGNIGATAPVGGVIGGAVKAIPGMGPLGTSIATAGFDTGAAPSTALGQIGNLGVRSLGGGINGYASAGLVNPDSANSGGMIGAAVPVASKIASLGGAAYQGVANTIRPVVQPEKFVGQGLANGMPVADAATAAANIRNAPQLVPGSMPTTAQAAQTPFMVQTEKAAANLPSIKSAMLTRGIDNNNARWAALNGVAQTPEALAAAQTARSQAASPLYAAAHQDVAPIDSAVTSVMQRPAVQQAMQQADTLAKNEGVQLAWPTADSPAISGHALDYTNRALGDMIDTAKRAGNMQQARALTDAQSQLKSWGENNIPALGQAAKTYAQMSVPVNTMEAAQQVADKLGGRAMNAAGVPDIQLNGYRSALAQAMKGSAFGIDPLAQGTLQGIGQDLQRSSISNAIKSPGSDTAYNLAANGWLAKNLYGANFQGATGLGKTAAAGAALLGGHPMGAAGILAGGNKLGQMVGGRLESKLSGLLMNPDSLLPYLDARVASPSLMGNLLADSARAASPLAYRVAPLLSSAQ